MSAAQANSEFDCQVETGDSVSACDVFLSYDSRDQRVVEDVARDLRAGGLNVFFARWSLVPGQPWQEELQRILARCRAVAVFLGAHEMGRWQQREAELALDRQARTPGFPVIPVLLPGADPGLGFLRLNTWVDLREDGPGPRRLLAKAVRGELPGPDLLEQINQTLATICPYRGLRPFREEDAPFFCGRDAFTAQLVKAVGRDSLIAVVGASGSGKSSVVRAGLLPALRRSRSGIGTVWDAVTMVPDTQPLRGLAAAFVPLLEPDLPDMERLERTGRLAECLATRSITLRDIVAQALQRQAGTDRLLLVVDQWEELYTLCQDEQSRRRLLDEVLEASAAGRLTVVLTLRGDFYGHAVSDRRLADRLQDAVVNLGPMTRSELCASVEEPARKVGLGLEAGLANRILDEVGDEPGNLPLLEFVLTLLWERRRGGCLLHETYEAIGGLRGAIAQHADAVYEDQLTPAQQDTARRVLIQLVQPGEGAADTRQRIAVQELGQGALPVIERLAAARLLVTGRDSATGETTVEVAHEALICNWQRLCGWINEDRDFLRRQARVTADAERWQGENRRADFLLQPGWRLAEAEDLLAHRRADLKAQIVAYIEASAAAHHAKVEAERQTARRRLRRARLIAVTMAVLALLAGIFGVLAKSQRDRAVAERERVQITESLRLAALSREQTAAGNATNGMLLALAALPDAAQPSPRPYVRQAELALYRAAYENREERDLRGHEHRVASAVFSPDGQRIVTTSADRTARLWDAATGTSRSVLQGHEDAVLFAAFSPDGQRIVTTSADRTARLWDAATGAAAAVLGGHEGFVWTAVFSRDGRRIVTASTDRTARLWDADTGAPLAVLQGHQAAVLSAAFSPDGQRVVTASQDRTARLWDAETGTGRQVLQGHAGRVIAAAFSPDGRHVVTASEDKTARLWDAETGRGLATLEGHELGLSAAVFSPDGRRIVTTSADHSVRLWDAATGAGLAVLQGHEGLVLSAAFSPDGRRIVTASTDGTARLWETLSGAPLAVLKGHEAIVVAAAFSPDGRHVVTASEDKTARLWDAVPGNSLAVLEGHTALVWSVAFSPDGQRVVTASEDKTARLWDAATGTALAILQGHEEAVLSAAFSPDGRRIVTASQDRTARLWDGATGAALGVLQGHEAIVVAAAFSPDGQRVVTASEDKTARLWDAATGTSLATLRGHNRVVLTAAFSPDGQRIVTASADGTARLWDAATGTAIAVLQGHQNWVLSAAFSPDGRRIVTASADGTARLWHADTGTAVAVLQGHGGILSSAAFNPDGRRVITTSYDHTARLWDADTGAVLATLQGHQDVVLSAAFSPDGRRVVTASQDRDAQLWDITTGTALAILDGHQGAVVLAAFSPDGRRIVTASADGTARLWRVLPAEQELIAHARAILPRALNAAEQERFFLRPDAEAGLTHEGL